MCGNQRIMVCGFVGWMMTKKRKVCERCGGKFKTSQMRYTGSKHLHTRTRHCFDCAKIVDKAHEKFMQEIERINNEKPQG